ncbi:peptidoglycan DD-metalloendopeptidase family protein [Fulvivirga sp. M361]|uniref:peptidoglycan DD-metalloendopeptidase family protein n=1 Tax=Fulvivirga sp. M361 TaxID=2594266 RepID=UPI001179FAEE|nr:peptidoglycan DD-metalloendopeptidase family protein [Fulvivirga sp. M361]TRX58366.1 peptidoglycan DD-metalloendopeptidase family protein [Fulvivirga sp. M361]
MSKKHLGLVIAAIFSVGFYFMLPLFDHEPAPIMEVVVVEQDTTVVIKPEPKRLYGLVVDSMVVIEDKIKRNQNISEILTAHNVSHQAIFELANVSKDVFDVRKMVANKKYILICDPDSFKTVKAFVYEHNPTEYVVFNLQDTISVEKKQKEITIIEKGVSGVIESNLSNTMEALGLSHQLTNDFVDVFAWQVDFFRLQKGDRFKLIYEDHLVEGQSIGSGKIKSIYFEHFGNAFYGFHYDQGDGIDYFDEDGKSLRKALLKYPLDFTRISSRYSGNRFHPVQKRWKAHRGTDFAAPKGTPIRSVGDGIVIAARYHKYNGNFVKIKHNSTYTTQYLHMSKIKSGIRPGMKVKQEDVIGYVGSTGLAKGNHLCYRFWKNGVQIDALRVELPPSAPITDENREEFEVKRDVMMAQLEAIPFPQEEETILASIK